jgi:cytochrome c peroxidase
MGDIMRTTLALIALSTGCFTTDSVDGFTEEEFEIIKQFGPLGPVPADPTNKYADDPAAAAFGQMLWFEKSYAKALNFPDTTLGKIGDTGKVGCVSCHDPRAAFADVRRTPTSLGVRWTPRNAPALVNSAYYPFPGWAGKSDSLWVQGANSSESGVNFGSNRLEFAHLLYRKYRTGPMGYEAIFGVTMDPALDPMHPDAARFPASGAPKAAGAADGPWEGMAPADQDYINGIVANMGKAFHAYERLLVSRNAPIDRYIEGDRSALSPAQKRGLALFIGKAACVDCHSGQLFSDYKFHNTGVAQNGPNVPMPLLEEGRFGDVKRTLSNTFNTSKKFSDDQAYGMAKIAGLEAVEEMKGQFQTMALRNITESAPYMHTGWLQSLEDVVRWYNYGGDSEGFNGTKHPAMVPLLLTPAEEADLVAFLKALTGEPLPEALTINTSLP